MQSQIRPCDLTNQRSVQAGLTLSSGITGALLHVMAEAVIRRIFDHGRQ
ncbi:hypothetical protein [Xanthomonas sp. BRIP62409]|nr:hypothetical protein [Xanthomonas sp. BRIP62409]